MKRVLVAGYKASELGIFSRKHPGIEIIKNAIKQRLLMLADQGLEWVIVSGQWGVELWAAEAVLELRDEHPALRLAVITPFIEQDEKWSEEKRAIYREVIGRADYVNSVSRSKYDGPWQFKEKNKFLLRNSDGIVVVYEQEQEGSPRYMLDLAVQHAKQRDYRIIQINAEDLQNIADEHNQDYWAN
ncbi:SLOG family protein [Paenibacillus xerothermodurans]|uniref:UPF0398 protein CBW46_006985 n=1 Tax=Paenibacillus xerothermodurans TaxID=1977292 RepID=A0A2W1P4Y9_PAEXE|nr:DUF1273 domain-containing protein [Paenibacillus xerothermodurans]PZE22228.1 DUF1273 domain-containing protein [Paenibacillus xerothermodurans]